MHARRGYFLSEAAAEGVGEDAAAFPGAVFE
jgi:hypothetical protein